MKRSIAVKWVEALRSGKYEQGTGTLRDSNNNFCCLGVLCNLHAEAHPKIAAKNTDPTEYLGDGELLPSAVADWAQMKHTDGAVTDWNNIEIDSESFDSLAEANDAGVYFDDIADWIEENYRRL